MLKKISPKFVVVAFVPLFFAACNKSSSTGTFSCSATGVVSSGDITQTGVAISMTGLTVSMLNVPDSGPFTISLTGQADVSSSATTYTYPAAVSLTTSAANTLSATVTVTDTSSTSNVATCSVLNSTAGTTSATSGAMIVTSLPSTTGSIGSVGIGVSATTVGAVNTVYTMALATTPTGVVLSQVGNGIALVTSSVATTVTLNISASSNGAVIATSSKVLTFSSAVASSNLQCVLFHYGSSYVHGASIGFNVATNTGESLQIDAWDAGESWDSEPTYPLYPAVPVSYDTAGAKRISMLVQSASSGAPCNGNGIVTDQLQVQ